MGLISQVSQLWSHQLRTKNRGAGLRSKVMRFAGAMLNYRQHREVCEAIAGPHTRPILQVFPQVVYRYTAAYLSERIELARRREMLKGHYAFINEAFHSGFFAEVLQSRLRLWGAEVEGLHLAIVLSGPCLVTKNREGDLVASLEVDGRLVGRLGFSIVPVGTLPDLTPAMAGHASHVLFIGQVQGQVHGFDLIREVTKACHEISPVDLLMSALAGFSAALGAHVMVGVSQENNVSFNDEVLSVAVRHFNYSEFWSRYGGIENRDGDFWIQVPFENKPIQQIAAKHRGRTLRKRAFKQQVTDAVCECVRTYLLPPYRLPLDVPLEVASGGASHASGRGLPSSPVRREEVRLAS